LYSIFREGEPEIAKRDKRVRQRRGELVAS
jgi:hypothetical protein